MNKLKEKLAELEHIQFACWTSYFLDNLNHKNMERWRRQIKTPYADLTEKEKDSDREWAERVLEILDDVTKENIESTLLKMTTKKAISHIVEDMVWGKSFSPQRDLRKRSEL